MSSKKTVSLILAVISLFVYYGQEQGWFASAATEVAQKAVKTAEVNQPGLYKIVSFSDGDTIKIDMNGTTETVRFIGVDTPETHDPRKPVQCYGPAASAFTKNTISSQRVRLGSDSLSSNRDRYKRLLRYVYLPDGTLMNKKLISDGYGFYYPYFPFTKSEEFATAQKEAQDENKGLWGNCAPTKTDRGGYVSNNQEG